MKQSTALKAMPKNVVTRFLIKRCEDFQNAWPLIKLCTGESFEKEHWRRPITMLQMPREVTFDNMKFEHIVTSVPTMLKRKKELKELADRAQGEVTIREAINELTVWCDETEF